MWRTRLFPRFFFRLSPLAPRPSLESEQHQRRGPRDGFEQPAEDAAVAVVDAALIHGSIEQQGHAFLNARMGVQSDLPQRQASPGSRLDPGEVILRPGPAGELEIDVVKLAAFGGIRHLAAHAEQVGRRCSEGIGESARLFLLRQREQDQGCRPNGFGPAGGQMIGAVGIRTFG